MRKYGYVAVQVVAYSEYQEFDKNGQNFYAWVPRSKYIASAYQGENGSWYTGGEN